MTEAEQALAQARQSKERTEQMRVEVHEVLANLRQATDEFVRELKPAQTT